MRVGQLLHEGGKIAIVLRPQDKMPVVRKQAVGAHSHGAHPQGFFQNLLERQVVAVLFEQIAAAHSSVKDVIDNSTGRATSSS